MLRGATSRGPGKSRGRPCVVDLTGSVLHPQHLFPLHLVGRDLRGSLAPCGARLQPRRVHWSRCPVEATKLLSWHHGFAITEGPFSFSGLLRSLDFLSHRGEGCLVALRREIRVNRRGARTANNRSGMRPRGAKAEPLVVGEGSSGSGDLRVRQRPAGAREARLRDHRPR